MSLHLINQLVASYPRWGTVLTLGVVMKHSMRRLEERAEAAFAEAGS